MTALPQEKGKFTYADYLEWDDDQRWELYDGEPVALAAPTIEHQGVVRELMRQIANYLLGKTCQVFPAPVDVRLFEEEGDEPWHVDTVFQPDLLVVCDPKKIDKRGIHGAPDMTVEILSPSTRGRDMVEKFNAYLRAGVREYWIVDPEGKSVTVHILKNGEYITSAFGSKSKVRVSILEDCTVDLSLVFPVPAQEEPEASDQGVR